MRSRHSSADERRPFRDAERGILLGVCAGLAEYLGCPGWLLRTGALLAGCFFTVPMIVAYLVAAVLLPERPLRYAGPGDEASFWRSAQRRSRA